MSDRELIEMAAKAMGISNPVAQSWPGMEVRYGFSCAVWDENYGDYFYPIGMNSDAFRLLVSIWSKIKDPRVKFEIHQALESGDPSRVRELVTSTAAEIGRAMQ